MKFEKEVNCGGLLVECRLDKYLVCLIKGSNHDFTGPFSTTQY